MPVERPVKVTLVGLDPAGREVSFELEGLSARAVQHEIDHLDGVLIIDRTDDETAGRRWRSCGPRPYCR